MKKLFLATLLFITTLTASAQNNLTKQEKEYLDFLYEYMPLSDKVDYDSAFFIAQVKTAIEARNTFSWGKKIPEDIFKHFVLVYRVNNENLDTARMVMFRMIKDRIKNMSMYDAALEVNHWCHEYVNYKASDGRTSAPLASMRTSWGRCGEESTFTVTALRSVGIPARQCYTPRWAHTDDNHAWVEVWVDGKWYHLGACEPEAKLNVGWFDAPSKRAMMVHTTVFGKYNGDEEKNFVSDKYSKINLLGNYAPTKKLTVTVKDESGNSVKGATVSFGLYNYAEYYPLAKITTNDEGKATLTTGYGDLMIWAKTSIAYAQKQAFAADTAITITIKKDFIQKDKTYTNIQTLTPPKPINVTPLDAALVKKNNERLTKEDEIRNAYIKTFPQSDDELIKNSWGNYEQIQKVLDSNHPLARKMLNMVYEKDLRDGEYDVFMDHLNNIKEGETSEYVINPRIALEKLTPWRSFIRKYFDNIRYVFANGNDVSEWVRLNIRINPTDNYYGVPISPIGVLKSRQSDEHSREILFVAICRSFGIQSRYEWATGRAQWRKDENSAWQYGFKKLNKKESNDCLLVVHNDENNAIKPEYYMQFTIQKFIDNEFQTLDYEYEPHFAKLPDTVDLSEGLYRIMVGNRTSSGKVQVSETYFTLKSGTTTDVTITIPEANEDITNYGKVNLNENFKQIFPKQSNNQKAQNIKALADKSKAIVLAIIDPYKEPSRHLLVDIAKSNEAFDKEQDVYLVLVLNESQLNDDFSTDVFPTLPKNTLVLVDSKFTLEKEIINKTNLRFSGEYPILTVINKDEVIYMSQGYKISSQEEVLKVIKKIK